MNRPFRRASIVAPVLLALAAAALYLPRLEDAPRYLVVDELYSALTAHSVATTGRDLHGAFLPLYFQMDLPQQGRPMWFQPMLVYAIALALKLRPFSEATIRVPMAVAGVANVVLMYYVALQLFGRQMFAIAAAGLLAITPAFFMYSRYAMDFAAPLPFILTWLLCLFIYLRRPDARLLAGAGLALGAGVYSYIASVAFMPLYALLTGFVLFLRREPASRYGMLIAGFIVPVLLSIPALARNPTLLHDIAVHYQPDASPATSGALQSVAAIMNPGRLGEAMSLYAGFWNPRFLFVDGPLRSTPATWLVGVFLLPTAGLLLIGVARALRRPLEPVPLVLMAGLLTAPIPASFAGQPEAIRRALELLPFAVLIGVYGLEAFWASKANSARVIGFIAFWSVVIAIALAGHDANPRAQAYVRAASVPLGVAALALVVNRVEIEALSSWRAASSAAVALFGAQVAYFIGAPTIVHASAAAAFAAAVFFRESRGRDAGIAAVAVLLALFASEFTFAYVDYPIRRIGPMPASALVFAARFAAASLTLAASYVAARAARRTAEASNDEVVASLAVVMALAVQVAYFYVDLFSNAALRFAHVAVVVVAAVALAAWSRRGTSVANRLGPLTAVGLLGLAALQFAYFYADYFTAMQARASSAAVGNVRLALESALDRVDGRPVPAIYLARLRNESPGLGDLYATFYLIKKGRAELIDRTVEGDDYMGFETDRVTALPPGSLVIVNPSARNEQNIDRLAAAGELRRDQLLKTPDGTPMFWILERTGR